MSQNTNASEPVLISVQETLELYEKLCDTEILLDGLLRGFSGSAIDKTDIEQIRATLKEAAVFMWPFCCIRWVARPEVGDPVFDG